jgi:hypothetical protein
VLFGEETGYCENAVHCTNGTLDGVESDIDCGGLACPACKGGQRCNVGTDCQSQACTDGICDPVAMCQDGVASEYEIDVDCGGRICPPCGAGKRCREGSDCVSGSCTDAVCDAVPQ